MVRSSSHSVLCREGFVSPDRNLQFAYIYVLDPDWFRRCDVTDCAQKAANLDFTENNQRVSLCLVNIWRRRRRCEDYDPAKSGAVIIYTVKVMLLSLINSSFLRWKGLKIRNTVTSSESILFRVLSAGAERWFRRGLGGHPDMVAARVLRQAS